MGKDETKALEFVNSIPNSGKDELPPPPYTDSLPTSGVALFPQYISQQETTLYMTTKGMWGTNFTVSSNDTPLFHVQVKDWSANHKMYITDARTNEELACIRIDWKSWHFKYSASSPSGAKLFDTKTSNSCSMFSKKDKTDTSMWFDNALDSYQPTEISLVRTRKTMNTHAEIRWQDQVVGKIDQKFWSCHYRFWLTVAAGMDPFLMVAMAAIIADEQRTVSTSAATGGASVGVAVAAS